jgi:hypothetical protein
MAQTRILFKEPMVPERNAYADDEPVAAAKAP